MNKLFSLLLGGSMLILASCGGGWSTDQKNSLKNECLTLGGYDCDCYVEKATSAFESPDKYNQKTDESASEFNASIEDCRVKVEEETEEEMESF